MNILYDLLATQPNTDGKFHGGGKYAKTVFLRLTEKIRKDLTVYGLFDDNKELDKDIRSAATTHGIQLIDIQKRPLKEICAKYAIDRFYSALPYHLPGITGLDCEVMGTIHGLRELEIGMELHSLQYFRPRQQVKALAKILASRILYKRKHQEMQKLISSIKIFTVSRHTKYALLNYYPHFNQEDIKVFYSPDVTGNPGQPADFAGSDYFLLVSGNRWLKNNLRAARALDELFSERKEIKKDVIITGVKDKGIYLSSIKNKERFIFYDYVEEDLLAALYRNAFAFIYLTLNEGFGYPPLEAMKFGTPVIASPFTSIPEICGDAVLYSNPYSLAEIKNRVLQLSDTVFYETMRSRSLERYAYIQKTQDIHLNELVEEILRS